MYRNGFGRFDGSDQDATPVGINVAVGAVAIVLATFLAARFALADAGFQDAVVMATIGVFAASTVDLAAVVLLLGPAWMIMNGFLVNRSGDLSWHGAADLYRFLLLAGAGAAGLVVGEIVRRVRDLQGRWRLGAVIDAMSTEFDEEKHRAGSGVRSGDRGVVRGTDADRQGS